MTHKDGCTATCPAFMARCDHKGLYYIFCRTASSWLYGMAYPDRGQRNAVYQASCCGNPQLCPLQGRRVYVNKSEVINHE